MYLKSLTTTDVKLYYTTDGSDPDATKTEYTAAAGIVLAPVNAETTVVIKAKAVGIANGKKDSAITQLEITNYPPNKVVISEYFEGSSNYKYIELTNTGSETVDLSNYSITPVPCKNDACVRQYQECD